MNIQGAERLVRVAWALEDAAKQPAFVASFTLESWGLPVPEALDFEEGRDYHDALAHTIYDELGFDEIDECGKALDVICEGVEQAVEQKLIPHGCGAPACSLGHFALRADLQDTFRLSESGRTDDVPSRQPHQ